MIEMRIFTSSLLVLYSLTACGGNGGESSPFGKTSVFKSMNTVQCGSGGLSLSALQDQLSAANVPVSSAACGNGGQAQPALCGAPDGNIGIFEIPSEKVSVASAAGFALLSTLPAAVTIACPNVAR